MVAGCLPSPSTPSSFSAAGLDFRTTYHRSSLNITFRPNAYKIPKATIYTKDFKKKLFMVRTNIYNWDKRNPPYCTQSSQTSQEGPLSIQCVNNPHSPQLPDVRLTFITFCARSARALPLKPKMDGSAKAWTRESAFVCLLTYKWTKTCQTELHSSLSAHI